MSKINAWTVASSRGNSIGASFSMNYIFTCGERRVRVIRSIYDHSADTFPAHQPLLDILEGQPPVYRQQ